MNTANQQQTDSRTVASWEKLQRGQRILWRLDEPNKWSLAYERYDTGTYGVNCYLTCEESTAIRILEAMDLLDKSVSIFKGRQWSESETLH